MLSDFFARLTSPFRPAERLDRGQRRLVLAVVAAAIFIQYDAGLFSLVLPYVQRDLQVPEGQVGVLGGLIRASALGSPLIVLLTARMGRRTLLLCLVAAYSLTTGLTALAPNAWSFVALQGLTRALISAEVMIAIVVLLDGLPRRAWGWGVGIDGSLGTFGLGAAYLIFPWLVSSPSGWRTLYAIGLVPALAVFVWRRALLPAQPGAFQSEVADRLSHDPEAARNVRPAAAIVWLAVVALLWSVSVTSAWVFIPKYLHDTGWPARSISTLFIVGQVLVLPAAFVVGRLSDRYGRRPTLGVSLALGVAAAFVVFNAPAHLPVKVDVGPLRVSLDAARVVVGCGGIALAWFLGAADGVVRVYAGELMPGRKTAGTSMVGTAWIVGGVLGLFGESGLYSLLGSHASALTALLVAAVVAVVVLAVAPLRPVAAAVSAAD